MTFSHPRADVYVPDGSDPAAALARVTHLSIGAHQDDLEIMAYAGISTCLSTPGKAFGGVVATNGAGSPRTGPFGQMTDEEMQQVRRNEQRRAADLGRYAIQVQLAHPTATVKQAGHADVVSDLAAIFSGCSPEVVYLHNPADKHDTHVALLLRCLEAMRTLPFERRPRRVFGCEVWRDLDWLSDAEKVALDAGADPKLAEALIAIFASQVAGGKRYDVATLGRRSANATFSTPRAADAFEGITWAVDLTPLIQDGAPSLEDFTAGLVSRFERDVRERIRRFA